MPENDPPERALAEYSGLLDPLAHGTRATDLTDDRAFLRAMVDAELALTMALIDTGLVPEWMAAVCAELADASTLDLAEIASAGRSGGNPVIPLVKALGARAESVRQGASDHLHVGTTSQDIVDTAAMLVARGATGEVLAQLSCLADRLAELVDQHRDTIMIGRTLGQHASPTTFGLVAAGWLDAVLNSIDGLDVVRRSLAAQLGGAVGTLAVLTSIAGIRRADRVPADTVDRVVSRFAERLGLAAPGIAWHTDRAAVAELASACSVAAGAAGRFALDVTVLARTEIAELGERLAAGEGGSSAMPHKRNPVTAVLVTASARRTPGLLATVHSSLLAEDQRPSGAWHAEWAALRDLEAVTIEAVTGAASLASRLDVDAVQMRANLDLTRGLGFSERVSTVLAEALGKRAAFDLVTRASVDAFDSGRPLQHVLAELVSGLETADVALRDRVSSAFEQGAAAESDLAYTVVVVDRVLDRYRARKSPRPEQALPQQTADQERMSRS